MGVCRLLMIYSHLKDIRLFIMKKLFTKINAIKIFCNKGTQSAFLFKYSA